MFWKAGEKKFPKFSTLVTLPFIFTSFSFSWSVSNAGAKNYIHPEQILALFLKHPLIRDSSSTDWMKSGFAVLQSREPQGSH